MKNLLQANPVPGQAQFLMDNGFAGHVMNPSLELRFLMGKLKHTQVYNNHC